MCAFIISLIFIFVLFTTIAVVNSKCYRPGPPATGNIPAPGKRLRNNMKVKLNMRSIIRWEQLRKKSFSLMDYSDKDDIEALLYTASICNNEGKMYTFEVFRQTLSNEKIIREMVLALERETAFLAQFQKKQEVSDLGSAEVSPGMISDLISTLIMSGLDAHYALEEMELCDLPIYIEAYDRDRKEQMESDRLWAYLNILPHVDGKKLPTARDLYTFPWEEEEIRKNAECAMKENEEDLKKFLSGELFDINSVNWSKRE